MIIVPRTYRCTRKRRALSLQPPNSLKTVCPGPSGFHGSWLFKLFQSLQLWDLDRLLHRLHLWKLINLNLRISTILSMFSLKVKRITWTVGPPHCMATRTSTSSTLSSVSSCCRLTKDDAATSSDESPKRQQRRQR